MDVAGHVMGPCCCSVLLHCCDLSLQTELSQAACHELELSRNASHKAVLSQVANHEAALSQAASHEAASSVLHISGSESTLSWVLCYRTATVSVIGYGHVGITASC